MYYIYILKSLKSGKFYIGWSTDLRKRLREYNSSQSLATKSGIPWELEFYASFKTKKLAKGFELYLKSGSGKAFAYKRLLP